MTGKENSTATGKMKEKQNFAKNKGIVIHYQTQTWVLNLNVHKSKWKYPIDL